MIVEQLIKTYTFKYKNRHYYEDLQQDCRLAIMESRERYRDNSKATLKTYLTSAIRRVIRRKSKEYRCIIHIPVGVSEDLAMVTSIEDTDRVVSVDYLPIMRHNLAIAREHLDDEHYNITCLYIQGYNKAEIGRKLGVSSETINNKIKKINKILKGKYEEVI